MSDDDVTAAQARADIATIAILQHRATLDTQIVNQQLSEALANRVVIEQAKGMIAERHGQPVDAAFGALRHHARCHNQHLAEVARGVVSGTMNLDVLPPAPP
jgi:AmiR/NasT family two-component response regulator